MMSEGLYIGTQGPALSAYIHIFMLKSISDKNLQKTQVYMQMLPLWFSFIDLFVRHLRKTAH